jgi:hypothetical protein
MNLEANPTTEQLRQLLAPCDDTAGDHVLWVSKTGEVRIARLPRGQSPASLAQAHPEVQMRCEAFLAGNEYVGPEAAEDEEWVGELFDLLVRAWRQAKGSSEVAYLDPF